MGWFGEALSAVLGGGDNSSTSSDYSGFIESLFESSKAAPQKEAKTHDEGIFNFGTNNERQPNGTTFKAYGEQHCNQEDALKYLDKTTCYSGTLRCPVCGKPKEKPSDVEKCRAEHRRAGYNC